MAQFGIHQRSQTFPSSDHFGTQALGRIPSNQSYIDLPSSSIYSSNAHIIPEPISYTHRLRTRSSPPAVFKSLGLSFPRSSTGYLAGKKGPLGAFSAENRSHTSYSSVESILSEDTNIYDSFDLNQDPFLNVHHDYPSRPGDYLLPHDSGYSSPLAISSVSLDLYLRDAHPAQEAYSTLANTDHIATPNTSDLYFETPARKLATQDRSKPSYQQLANDIPQTPIRNIRSSARIDFITRDLQALETPRSPGIPKSPDSQIRLGSNGVLLTPGDRDGVMGLGIVYPLPPKRTPLGAKRRVLSYHSVRDEHISPYHPDTPIKKFVRLEEHQSRTRYRTISTGAVLPLPTNRTSGRTYRRRLGKYPFNHAIARLLFFSMVGFLLTAIFGVGSDPATHAPGFQWTSDDIWMVGDEGQVFGIYGPAKPAFAISMIRSYDNYDLLSTQDFRRHENNLGEEIVEELDITARRMADGRKRPDWSIKMRRN